MRPSIKMKIMNDPSSTALLTMMKSSINNNQQHISNDISPVMMLSHSLKSITIAGGHNKTKNNNNTVTASLPKAGRLVHAVSNQLKRKIQIAGMKTTGLGDDQKPAGKKKSQPLPTVSVSNPRKCKSQPAGMKTTGLSSSNWDGDDDLSSGEAVDEINNNNNNNNSNGGRDVDDDDVVGPQKETASTSTLATFQDVREIRKVFHL
jgi:hypothetical protein